MQTLAQLQQFFGKSRTFLLPQSHTKRTKLQSASFDAITSPIAREFIETGPKIKKIVQSTTIEDFRFYHMASEAARVDSRSAFFKELKFNEDIFRSESSEATFSMDLPYPRTDGEVRKDYIERLTYMKLIKSAHAKPHQTLIIFDWDDTLLPTSYLCYIGLEKLTPALEKKLEGLDRMVVKLLNKAVKVGKVCIVTNAMESWVESSCKMYLPLTSKVLEEKDIPIISARAECEEAFPDDPKRWKNETFSDIGRSFDPSILTNILCFGDSEIEMDAANNLSKQFKQAVVKTVKLKACRGLRSSRSKWKLFSRNLIRYTQR